ncbi:sn-glycerol-3-phosphate ABC transporter ATP-binding protein UgpC [Roseibium sp. HPY-6]|uniref:ABC transporter ATP-binding protein n=1 Tax=Roseibium sp. HPY-6 TaxID=3229852 RepID=UPI00338E3FB2
MARVILKNLGKQYAGTDTATLHDLNLEIADGEFLVLVGPSGCGKSTALKLIAGLEDITTGEVQIGDQIVNEFASRDRDIAMVFQSYALYPHLSVFDNIAFPLQIARVPKNEIRQRVKDVAKTLQLEPFLTRKPACLSGGQRQRVAMGRAIIRRPSVFLMDEPLSNLDAKLRVKMRSEVAQIQRQLAVTTIYVTHDQVEAMTMGDRVALMRDGVLQQVDTPDRIYHHPANTFVAAFIGSPAMNLFRISLLDREGTLFARFGEQDLKIPESVRLRCPQLRMQAGGEVVLGVRPEDIEDAEVKSGHPADQCLDASVALIESLGSDHMAHVMLEAKSLKEVEDDDGDLSKVDFQAQGGISANCVCRFSSRSRVKTRQKARLAIDCERLHFFHPETGRTLEENLTSEN